MSNTASAPVSFSVVLPCLNEGETVGACIDDIHRVLRSQPLPFEIIVADNGSTDDSVAIAQKKDVHVVREPMRGYGRALMAGIGAAQGDMILMMDSDSSYHAEDIPAYIDAFLAGADCVMGRRHILAGAMPFLHRYVGNPFFTWLMRTLFHLPLHDVHCGMRAIRRSLLPSLTLTQPGMEFAMQLLLEVHTKGGHFAEVPITLHPDGRHLHGSHLHTLRDGWKALLFICRYALHNKTPR